MNFRITFSTLIVLFLCLSFNLLSQEWFPTGATWIYNTQKTLPFQAHGIRKYVVDKDTLLLNMPAKTIVNTVISYNGQLSSKDTLFVYERNEQVFILRDGRFQLVYDLSLSEGSIFKMDFGCADSISVTVDSIGRTEQNGISLKVQYLSFKIPEDGTPLKVNEVVIEKIGSETDFLYSPGCHSLEQFAYQGLRCYTDKNIFFENQWWKYFHPEVACDSLIDESNVGVEKNRCMDFSIYPNPVYDTFSIRADDYSSKLERVEIVNLCGVKVMELATIDGSFLFNISGIPNGFYVVNLFDHSGFIVQKKIVKKTK